MGGQPAAYGTGDKGPALQLINNCPDTLVMTAIERRGGVGRSGAPLTEDDYARLLSSISLMIDSASAQKRDYRAFVLSDNGQDCNSLPQMEKSESPVQCRAIVFPVGAVIYIATPWQTDFMVRGRLSEQRDKSFAVSGTMFNPESPDWIIPRNIEAAEAGDGKIQLVVGRAYDKKRNEEGFKSAKEWFEKAYKNNDEYIRSMAALELGSMYQRKKDNEQARLWLIRSYEISGGTTLATRIGSLYKDVSDKERLFWYERAAAERGSFGAHCTVAYFYENGIGTDVDRQRSLRWLLDFYDERDVDVLLKAANSGNEEARETLKKMLHESNCRLRQFEGAAIGRKTIDWYLGLEKETEQ